MNIQDILARILNPGAQNQLASAGQQPSNALTAPFQAASMFGVSNPNSAPRMPMQPQVPAAPQEAPVSAFQAPQAPKGAPMLQAAPAPRSGGIGDFLGGIIAPQRAQRNQTVRWLQQQGLDEGTATLLAGNKQALQQYLLQRSQGADPMDALNLEKTQLEIEQMRNPTTDDIREYQFAKQEGYQGSLTDFMQEMKKAGAQNITVGGGKYGSIPAGYELVEGPDGATMRPIPGGPVASEMEAAQRAEEAKTQQQQTATDIVTEDIDRALEIIDTAMLPVTGAVGGAMAGIGGTEARDLRALLDTVKAKAGFRELQAMRDASPTGGALGQVTERELAMLQATIGNLEQSQSAEQLKRNLQRVRKVYEEIIHGPDAARGSKPANKPVSEMTDEELEAIVNGQ